MIGDGASDAVKAPTGDVLYPGQTLGLPEPAEQELGVRHPKGSGLLDPDHPMFWCDDEKARDLLVRHGAPPGLVWVREEVEQIVAANPDRDAMSLIIEAKREFDGAVRGDGAGGVAGAFDRPRIRS